jgi:hypothetical protein
LPDSLPPPDVSPEERALFRSPTEERPRRRGLWGDSVLVRTKGGAGLSADAHEALWRFGLRDSGDTAHGFVTRRDSLLEVATAGQRASRFVPLTAHAYYAARRRKLRVVDEGSGGVVRTAEFEALSDRRGRAVTLENGEYLRFTQGSDCVALHWSCGLPLRSFIELVVHPLNGEKVRFESGYLSRGDKADPLEADFNTVFTAALAAGDPVRFVRFDTPKIAVSWRGPVGYGFDAKIPLNEGAIVSRVIDHAFFADVLLHAATQFVGRRRMHLLEQFEDLEAAYPVESASA